MNIQGDEPMINPLDIKNLNKLSKEKNLNISTLAYNIEKKEDYDNENIVKVITKNEISDNSATEAINFYRVIKENTSRNIYQHLGIYLYKNSALKKFVNFEKSKNEIKERLEQLRAIDNNMKINVILANYFSSGIDTKKDLEDYIKSFKK
jgi:3-deoxy-manno-octulosonate cytidylyltransferase (CMP-KDO synthetase)